MNESSSFSTLRDDCWEDPPTRERYLSLLESRSVFPQLPNQASYKRLFGTFGPALGLLKIARLDSTYLRKTAFNPFTLFRVGNSLAEQFVSQKGSMTYIHILILPRKPTGSYTL
jgi:hypothetical protein